MSVSQVKNFVLNTFPISFKVENFDLKAFLLFLVQVTKNLKSKISISSSAFKRLSKF